MRVIAILFASISLLSAHAADKAQCDDKASLEKAVSDLRNSPETNPAECPNAKPLPSILNGFDPRRPPTAGREMKSIEMPIDGKVAKLFYANYPASAKSKGTVIVLGGGPAMPWIERGRPTIIPKDYDVIIVDYPGIGANAQSQFFTSSKSSAYTLNAAAMSVKEIVRQNGLKNYMLMGHSYGTAVATGATNMIENDPRVERPRALLLEGTLGRSFRPGKSSSEPHEQEAGFINTSKRALALLSNEDRQQFQQKIKAIASNKPAHEIAMAQYMYHQLSQGASATSAMIRELNKMPNDQILSCAKTFLKMDDEQQKLNPLSSANALKNVTRSACEMIQPSKGATTFPLFEGLVSKESSLLKVCQCASSKDAGIYDAAKFPIKKTPIFYISGDSDPNTPSWQLDYHKKQMTAPSATYGIADGGHADFFAGMMEKRCYDNSFATAFKGATDQWANAMDDCQMKITFENPPFDPRNPFMPMDDGSSEAVE